MSSKNDNNIKAVRKKRSFKDILFKVVIGIIFFVSLGTLIYSGYKIYRWYDDNRNNEQLAKEIQNNTKTNTKDGGDLVNPPEDTNDSYWKYKNMNLSSVDFSELLKENSDTVGWIWVNGTDIDFPVVKTSSNSYYLRHSFDKTYNGAGWIFMDYRNNNKDFDYNTVIYGHSMKNHSMFWSLRKTLNREWYNNYENRIIKFSTPYENTLWQVFSVYKIKAESYYIRTDFYDDNDFSSWISKVKSRSMFDFGTSVNAKDKVITLSSCYDSNDTRMVLHAKLIKKEVR